MSATGIAALHAAFSEPFGQLGQNRERDRDTVVVSWPSVPVEVLRAAGFMPVLARSGPAATPTADTVLEPGVFPGRIRQLFEAALTGALAQVAAIVLPRTSDADYKAFLYLKELQRRGGVAPLPPVLLFDLLQSPTPEVAPYNEARVRELAAQLGAIAGRPVTPENLHAEIARSNAARGAARRLAALRRNPPRLRGSEALPLLGAFWQLPPERYVAAANAALEALAGRATLAGPRVLLAGAPVDSPALHAAIESLHATVVDETSPFGGDLAVADVTATGDPCAALAHWYGHHSLTARSSAAALLRRTADALVGIDAVVVVLPPDDARFGWDYPQLRGVLEQCGIPHAVLAIDQQTPLGAAERDRLQSLLAATAPRQAVRHG